jgi:hypothetical protein
MGRKRRSALLILRLGLRLRLILRADKASFDANRVVTGQGDEGSGKSNVPRLVFLLVKSLDGRLNAAKLGVGRDEADTLGPIGRDFGPRLFEPVTNEV